MNQKGLQLQSLVEKKRYYRKVYCAARHLGNEAIQAYANTRRFLARSIFLESSFSSFVSLIILTQINNTECMTTTTRTTASTLVLTDHTSIASLRQNTSVFEVAYF